MQNSIIKLTTGENFDVTEYLLLLTGSMYSFAYATQSVFDNPTKEEIAPKGMSFHQLMPIRKDDVFFNWYCREKPNNQYFLDPMMCVLAFNIHWYEWLKIRKPLPNDKPQLLAENAY